MSMVIVWALSWWYGAGYKARLFALKEWLASSYDYFSIRLLISTLFAPFRQISAGRVNGPIGVKLRAFADRLISRFIGAFVRTVLIVAGCIWLAVQAIAGTFLLIVWAFVPFLPFIGFILALSGWTPSW